jgi:hypothetical protein
MTHVDRTLGSQRHHGFPRRIQAGKCPPLSERVAAPSVSADDVFPELYTAWHLATAARISPQVTLTKFDLIGF